MRAAVFLDRDGVLNEVVERDGQPGSPRTLEEFRAVADLTSVARLNAAGMLVFVITNQPDIARGHVTEGLVVAMIEVIRTQVPIDDYRICAHEDRDGCACRKPKPGMIHDLARGWHVDLRRSFVIGDTWRDLGAAQAAGCGSVLIRRPYNATTEAETSVDSLSSAVDLVVGADAG